MIFKRPKIRLCDIGIFPLLMTVPFMYYPRVIDGDTQPWILLAAVLAFFTFRTDRFLDRRDSFIILLIFSSILLYIFRSSSDFGILRNTYTYLIFFIFWTLCRRENGEYFSFAIKATVIIWFLVGVYQFVSIKIGYPIDFPGRYVVGRGGVPSLTAEPSFYGSLSVIQLMYLICEKKRSNNLFIICAIASVGMSGSLLAMILIIFPVLMLPPTIRAWMFISIMILVTMEYMTGSFGIASRMDAVTSRGIDLSSLLLDASLNLRAGHLYFTMYENLPAELFFYNPINFMYQYNLFASQSGLFMETGSNYVLSGMGEMIYGTGILAIILLVLFLKRVMRTYSGSMNKIIKVIFILLCMMNPISLANIFLVSYALKKE